MSATANLWDRYEPSDAAPWNLARVVHLHRRGGFAASWPIAERDLADGPQKSIDRLLAGTVRNDVALAEFELMSRTIGDAAVASGNPNRLKAWWIYRMIMSPDPLAERLTLMWHNHFATSNRKVQDLGMMRSQNEQLRKQARGPFGELLAGAVTHPAMLLWLDADSNRKGKPNENLGRELMELFTLGVGLYTEKDVSEAARALTGWTVSEGSARFVAAQHDADDTTVLGHSGKLSSDDLLKLLLEHPATARRLAWRLCETFLGEAELSEAELCALAEGLRVNQLNISWGVETVLRSKRFFSNEAIGRRVAGPAEWAVGVLSALELRDPPPSTLLVSEWVTRMGQDLFFPPNVGGWNEGRSWLGSRAIISRTKFALALVAGQTWNPTRPLDLWNLVQRRQPTDNLAEAVRWFSRLLWGTVDERAINEILTASKGGKVEENLATAVGMLLVRPENQLA